MSTAPRTVYATHTRTGMRLGALLDAERGQVLVHIVGEGQLGWFDLSRLPGGVLTSKSLAGLS